MGVQLVLQLFEDEYFARRLREAPDAHLLELVILEEGLGRHQVPAPALVHLFDHSVVPIVAHVAEEDKGRIRKISKNEFCRESS